jgi:hypothetical protein
MIAVGQGEAATEVVVEIATIGETEVEKVTQTASGLIDRTGPVAETVQIELIAPTKSIAWNAPTAWIDQSDLTIPATDEINR